MKKILKVLVLVIAGVFVGSLYSNALDSAQAPLRDQTDSRVTVIQWNDLGSSGNGGDSGEDTVVPEEKLGYKKITYTNVISEFDATLHNQKKLYMVGDELKLSGPRDVIESGYYYEEIPKEEEKEQDKGETKPSCQHDFKPKYMGSNAYHKFQCTKCSYISEETEGHDGLPCSLCDYGKVGKSPQHRYYKKHVGSNATHKVLCDCCGYSEDQEHTGEPCECGYGK